MPKRDKKQEFISPKQLKLQEKDMSQTFYKLYYHIIWATKKNKKIYSQ